MSIATMRASLARAWRLWVGCEPRLEAPTTDSEKVSTGTHLGPAAGFSVAGAPASEQNPVRQTTTKDAIRIMENENSSLACREFLRTDLSRTSEPIGRCLRAISSSGQAPRPTWRAHQYGWRVRQLARRVQNGAPTRGFRFVGSCPETVPCLAGFLSLHVAPLRSRQRTAPLAACCTPLRFASGNRRDREKPDRRESDQLLLRLAIRRAVSTKLIALAP